MTREIRQLAQDMVGEYGWSCLADRMRIMEWLDGRGLLSPAGAIDHRADEEAADEFESYARWLLS